jgi:hypothetical protein
VKLHRYMTVSTLAAAGLLTAACGASPAANPDTAAKIVPAMQAAVKSATSVHISGSVKDGSQQDTIDMSFAGNDASGTVSQGGQAYTILLVADKAYVKVDQGFLKAANLPASDCTSMCGKYVAVPGSQISQLTGSLSLARITNQFVSSLPSSVRNDTADVFQKSTFDGQKALKFAQGRYTIDVADTGTPYLLYISDSSNGNNLTFSQWNSVPPLTPPPASEVITI